MIRRIFVVFVFGAAALGVGVTITVLRQRLEQVEARVAELERQTPQAMGQAEGVSGLPVSLDGKWETMPEGWIPREFNGMRYYDIPLNKTFQSE